MDNGNNRFTTKNIVISILFLIWFFGSLVAMMCCSESQNKIGFLLTLIGQYFLVFGIIAVAGNRKQKPFPIVVLIFPLVGIALMVCGISSIAGGDVVKETLVKYAPYIIIWIFPIAGILMVFGSMSKIRYLKRVCTREIQAKCVDIEVSWVNDSDSPRRTRVYMPLYSIYYNGEERLIRNNMYTNMNRFEIGSYYYIKINPSNPDEFIDDNNKKGNMLIFILGIVFIVLSVPVLGFMYIGLI